MIAQTLKELFEKIKTWYEEDIPNKREQNDQQGRRWYTDSLPWEKDLKVESLKKATDREQLNSEYVQRWKVEEPTARQGISAHKLEISQLYSWNKSFVQRYKSRLRYYADDLSQKKHRTMYCPSQAHDHFDRFKNETMNKS